MSYKITADAVLIERPVSMSLEVDDQHRGLGKLRFQGGPLNLNDALDDILKALGDNTGPAGNPFKGLPELLVTEFDLFSFDNGNNGTGLKLEAQSGIGEEAFTVRYGTYSQIDGGSGNPQSFSLLLKPFVIETLPGVNLRLDPPIRMDIQEAGIVTGNYNDENGNEVQKGVFIRAQLSGPGFNQMLVYPVDTAAPVEAKTQESNAETGEGTSTPAQSVEATNEISTDDGLEKWWDINKTLGPARVRQVGLKWKDGKITALVNADIAFGGITLSLMGLQASVVAGIPPSWPSFAIDGLGLDFKQGGIEVGGSFLKTDDSSDIGVTDRYEGSVTVKFEDLLIYGSGAYAKIQGHDSIFAYVFVGYPLGGPSFFFVEGLALGFGYNRGLIAPPLNQVQHFPLVTQAMGTGPDDDADNPLAMLQKMDAYIPPMEGEMLLAAGIKFNTFKVLDSFLLLTVSFGAHTRFELIGLSRLALPPKDSNDSKAPVVFVEIALEASFDPEAGLVQVNGLITNNSYVYSKDAHLSGNFAFYSWFKDQSNSGAKAGDFVVSLGGYHPNFKKPNHYPSVPRIALNWRVDSHLDIKGDGYFAMTPRYTMAGFNITATYVDGSLSAVFSQGADFLIQWKPFHYDITAYISIHASFEVKIDLWLTTVHKSLDLDLGADLHIWGPDFSGHADIHVKVMGIGFSFPVNFGKGAGAPAALTWSQFQKSFLPAPNTWISVNATKGLIKTVDDEAGESTWLLNPKDLCIEVNTEVPLTEINDTSCERFGVAPMQQSKGTIKSKMTLNFSKRGNGSEDPVYKDFNTAPLTKNMPAALWGEYTDNPGGSITSENDLIPLTSGVQITLANAPVSPESKHIREDSLSFDTEASPQNNYWSDGDSASPGFSYNDDLFNQYLPAYHWGDFQQLTCKQDPHFIQTSQALLATPVGVSLVTTN